MPPWKGVPLWPIEAGGDLQKLLSRLGRMHSHNAQAPGAVHLLILKGREILFPYRTSAKVMADVVARRHRNKLVYFNG